MIANRELEMLENAKLEFLSIISHEIRTPLNGIKGLTEILKNSIDKPDLLEYLNYLEQSARRLEKFSTQALLITELRTKVYRMEFDNVSIASLYTNATKNNEIKIKEKNVRVEYLRDADLLGINGDSNLIQICFDCLIDNAVEYSAKNSEVLVHTYKDENSITIEFTDNGVGFSKIALKNLFRFFRVGEKHIDKNIGLNLALVKLIMDAHKGEIKVVNNKPNGATVKLIFRN
jgi:two-component system sensor histidine kinase/response regulator